MDYNDDILRKIEEYAAALMTPFDIAMLLDIDTEQREAFITECLQWKKSPLFAAFHKGRIATKLELHEKVIKLAKAGSPKADELTNEWLKAQNTQS